MGKYGKNGDDLTNAIVDFELTNRSAADYLELFTTFQTVTSADGSNDSLSKAGVSFILNDILEDRSLQ